MPGNPFVIYDGDTVIRLTGTMTGGGGGALPAWWTVVSTPGAESVDFAGAVMIAPTGTTLVPLTINLPVGMRAAGTDPVDLNDEDGQPLITISTQGDIAIFGRAGDDPSIAVNNGDYNSQAATLYSTGLEISKNTDDPIESAFFVLLFSHAGANLGQTFTVGARGWVDMLEQAEPAAPAANNGRLFVKDTGGKSQLLIRFPSGASQVIATEP